MEIVAAKLVTRELVIGKLGKDGSIESPLIFFPRTDGKNVQISLIPYVPPIFTPVDSVKVEKKHIMMVFEVSDDIKKAYIESVTGISIVPDLSSVENEGNKKNQ